MTRALVVCEARADFEAGTLLAERVLAGHLDWFTEGVVTWAQGDGPNGRDFLARTAVASEAAAVRIQVRGCSRGPDHQAGCKAIALAALLEPKLDALILLRDVDDQPERAANLLAGRDEARPSFPVVVGATVPKREAWVLIALGCRPTLETSELRRELGFDPTRRPEGLTAARDGGTRDVPSRTSRVTPSSRRRGHPEASGAHRGGTARSPRRAG